MCGRYQLTTEENIQEIQEIVAEINRRYMDKPILSQMKLGEIRPTDIVPVIANSKSFEPKPFLMQWGFSGFGDKPKPIINAVSETALTKNMFRKPLLDGCHSYQAVFACKVKNDLILFLLFIICLKL